MKHEVKYQVVSLDDVMAYFAKDFELPKGHKLTQAEHFIDLQKGKVVYQLTVQSPGE